MKSLQQLPISTPDGTLIADLRISSSRGILAHPECRSGEDKVMKRFVGNGDVVFDIGAHFGFYTLLLSKLVGDTGAVHAFEPNQELLQSLESTIEFLDNVDLHRVALSDRSGTIELYVPEDASMASLSDWTGGIGGKVHSVSCEMRVLDEMLDAGLVKLPSFIKCDVEGAELLVFAGAKKILDRVDAPVVLFELNRKAAESFGAKTSDYFAFFESLENPGYTFLEVAQEGVRPLETRDIEYTNVIAVPAAVELFNG